MLEEPSDSESDNSNSEPVELPKDEFHVKPMAALYAINSGYPTVN